MKTNVEKRNQNDFKKDFLKIENMSEIKGGVGGGYTFEFCLTIEVEECITEEAEYCGTNIHEIKGPVNPWGN